MGNKTPSIAASPDGIARAIAILQQGGLVAVPTETVYGLAALAHDAEAVARIYVAKGRPAFNPLIVHVATLEQAALFTDMDRRVAPLTAEAKESTLESVAAVQWRDCTTLVVPLKAGAPVAANVTAGLDTIALRMPNHPVARSVIEEAGPLAAPSANRSGFTSPTTAEHVLATLDGRIDLVLDGGPSATGVESTIVKLDADGRWRELRSGPNSKINFQAGNPGKSRQTTLEAPGQLDSHYSPGKPVRLQAEIGREGEFMIGFGEVKGDCSLSLAGDLKEAARNLYACLYEAAASDKPLVAVAAVPGDGVGIAINDRLRRAAT